MRKVFIQANKKQAFGAKIAQFAIERNLKKDTSIQIEIMVVEEIPAFQNFVGKEYFFNKKLGLKRTYTFDDLQAFTLTRFMPPELMGFSGKVVVIDPDVFALVDITDLFELDMGNHAILAPRKKDAWDTSTMLLDCEKLDAWKIDNIIGDIVSGRRDYNTWITIREEKNVGELSRRFDDLDLLTPETKMLHTTGRLTQPWKTGLPIDFTRNKMPKLFGIIPREPIHKLLGKYPTHYQPHPDKNIEKFFFDLLKEALHAGAVKREQIEQEIAAGNVRKDIFKFI
ncbi:hypothetical protein L0Y69_02025 [bacterium]|nr:hypothetical protein [bacterium]